MIIGIAGKMGSGKDTAGDYLKSKYLFKKVSFAAKVKEIGNDLFAVEKKDKWGRYVYQQVGSLMRQIKSTVWIDYLFRKIDDIRLDNYDKGNPDTSFVITDVRYVNEASHLLNHSGHNLNVETKLIILDVPSEERRIRCQVRDKRMISPKEWEESSQHSSETGVDEILEKYWSHEDVSIINPSSVGELHEMLDQILDS